VRGSAEGSVQPRKAEQGGREGATCVVGVVEARCSLGPLKGKGRKVEGVACWGGSVTNPWENGLGVPVAHEIGAGARASANPDRSFSRSD
jgi:hypothetical protein